MPEVSDCESHSKALDAAPPPTPVNSRRFFRARCVVAIIRGWAWQAGCFPEYAEPPSFFKRLVRPCPRVPGVPVTRASSLDCVCAHSRPREVSGSRARARCLSATTAHHAACALRPLWPFRPHPGELDTATTISREPTRTISHGCTLRRAPRQELFRGEYGPRRPADWLAAREAPLAHNILRGKLESDPAWFALSTAVFQLERSLVYPRSFSIIDRVRTFHEILADARFAPHARRRRAASLFPSALPLTADLLELALLRLSARPSSRSRSDAAPRSHTATRRFLSITNVRQLAGISFGTPDQACFAAARPNFRVSRLSRHCHRYPASARG